MNTNNINPILNSIADALVRINNELKKIREIMERAAEKNSQKEKE